MKDNKSPMHDPAEHRAIAARAARAFGGPFHVREYYHDTQPLTIDILRCDDRPRDGETSYSTIGLSDRRLVWGDKEFPTRLELAGVCATSAESFPNVLSSAAFRMIRNEEIYHPGAVIENYVRLYFPSSPLPHLYFTSPFSWSGLTIFNAGSRNVTWLQAVPISDSERAYLKSHGEQALERLFRERHVDGIDINRTPVL